MNKPLADMKKVNINLYLPTQEILDKMKEEVEKNKTKQFYKNNNNYKKEFSSEIKESEIKESVITESKNLESWQKLDYFEKLKYFENNPSKWATLTAEQKDDILNDKKKKMHDDYNINTHQSNFYKNKNRNGKIYKDGMEYNKMQFNKNIKIQNAEDIVGSQSWVNSIIISLINNKEEEEENKKPTHKKKEKNK